MIDFLAKKFIKNSEDVEDPAVRAAYGKLSGWVGIICNVFLCAGKFIAGLLSGSMSVTADAVNNLSDASSGVIGLIGFKLSERSADKEHPYGHGRYEYLAGFMVAALIMIIGAELLRDSVMKIISPTEVEFGAVTIVVLSASVLVKICMMLFYKRIGGKINSETIIATAADSRNDVISTSAVLAALIISHFCDVELDGVMGALVAVFILYSGVGLVKDAMDPLLGKAPSEETVEDIREKILSYDGILGTHDLMIHDYGPGRQFASVHVEMSADTGFVECHEIIDRIERDFLAQGLNMIVHPDPIVSEMSENGRVTAELKRAVCKIDERITVHDVRVVECGDSLHVAFDCVVPPGSGLEEKALSDEITRFMRIKFPDICCEISFESSFASIPKNNTKAAH